MRGKRNSETLKRIAQSSDAGRSTPDTDADSLLRGKRSTPEHSLPHEIAGVA